MFALPCTVQLEKTDCRKLAEKCSRHLIYARPCVNKDFVHSGSIELMQGKHARMLYTKFVFHIAFALRKFDFNEDMLKLECLCTLTEIDPYIHQVLYFVLKGTGQGQNSM